MIEPHLLRKQLFQSLKDHLQITEGRVGLRVRRGLEGHGEAGRRHPGQGPCRARPPSRRTTRIAILMLGRPYHLDPGLNHAIPEEFQVLGYPVLSIRSIPKDETYLTRYFKEGPRVRAHHDAAGDRRRVGPRTTRRTRRRRCGPRSSRPTTPNVVVLDLSSFQVRPRRRPRTESSTASSRRRARLIRRCTTSMPTSRAARSRSASRPTRTAWACTRSGSRDRLGRQERAPAPDLDQKRLTCFASRPSSWRRARTRTARSSSRSRRSSRGSRPTRRPARDRRPRSAPTWRAEELKQTGIVSLGIKREDGRVEALGGAANAAN